MPESDFLELAPETITWEQCTGPTDLYGTRAYASPRTYACYIDDRARQIMTKEGETKVTSATIYLLAAAGADPTAPYPPAVAAEDRITMPTSRAPSQPAILSVNRLSDDKSGGYAVVIYT